MSITVPGLVEAGPFKVTSPVSAGFVKNEADGDLVFGQLASAWDLIEFREVGTGSWGAFAAVLNGDVDEVYQVILQGGGSSSSGGSVGSLRFNGLSFAALGGLVRTTSRLTTLAGTSVGSSTDWFVWSDGSGAAAATWYYQGIVFAKSGKNRSGIGRMVSRRGAAIQRIELMHRWNNTTTNITSIGAISTFGYVRRGWLYKIKKTP